MNLTILPKVVFTFLSIARMNLLFWSTTIPILKVENVKKQ